MRKKYSGGHASHNNARSLCIVPLLLLLSGCGGSSGSDSSSDGLSSNSSGGQGYKSFSYVTHFNNDNISLFQHDEVTGQLSPVENTVAGDGPWAIATESSGNYLYVANRIGNTVSQYRIESDHSLSVIGKIATASEPVAIAVDPSGRYVYTANLDGDNISQYQIGPDGVLISLGDAPSNWMPISLAFHPNGDWLYVAGLGGRNPKGPNGDSLWQHTIGADGRLSFGSQQKICDGPIDVQMLLSGSDLYVVCSYEATIKHMKIANDGLPELHETLNTGELPRALVIDAAGEFAYLSELTSGEIVTYKIRNDGTLRVKSRIPTGGIPNQMSFDSSDSFLYVTDLVSDTIYQFAIETDGSLTPLAPPRTVTPMPSDIVSVTADG